jgi:hypothetical protein
MPPGRSKPRPASHNPEPDEPVVDCNNQNRFPDSPSIIGRSIKKKENGGLPEEAIVNEMSQCQVLSSICQGKTYRF